MCDKRAVRGNQSPEAREEDELNRKRMDEINERKDSEEYMRFLADHCR